MTLTAPLFHVSNPHIKRRPDQTPYLEIREGSILDEAEEATVISTLDGPAVSASGDELRNVRLVQREDGAVFFKAYNLLGRIRAAFPSIPETTVVSLSTKSGVDNLLQPDVAAAINHLGSRRAAFFDDILASSTNSSHIANHIGALSEGEVRAWGVVHSAGKATAARNLICLRLFDKIDANNLSVLRTNLLSSLDDAKLNEFGDDFGETIVATLQRMNNDISIFNYWRLHKQEFLIPYVTNTGDIPSVATVAASFQGNSEITALINAVDAAPLPSGNQFAMAGCHHPSLVTAYQIKYNFTSATTDYQAFLSSCHPLLRDRIKYMDMIRNDFVADPKGTAYARLINIDDLDKLTFAGEAGRHAELQSLSETLYRIEQAENMVSGTFPKSRLSEVSIFVKNKNGNVMQRCPCCFHGSHDHNVNMVNLPGND